MKQVPQWCYWEVSHDDIAATYGIPYISGDYMSLFLYEYESIYNLIVAGDLAGALSLLEQFDSEAKQSHYRCIGGVCKFLLSQLIRRRLGGPGAVDGGRHTDRVVAAAARDAVRQIVQLNERHTEKWDPIAGRNRWQRDGWEFTNEELNELLAEEWVSALIWAGLTVLDGERSDAEIEALVDKQDVLAEALQLILAEQNDE